MSEGFRFFDAQYAVQCFYVISGFLISLILTEQGAYRSARDFYIARYLRLFPVYIVVAALSMAALLILEDPQFWRIYTDDTPLWTRIWLGISNVVLFGQAQVLFFAQQGGEILFPISYSLSETVLWRGLVNPPAWTLEIELLFYLIAPFVLRRKGLLFVLLGFSIGVRVLLWQLELIWTDPWTYRFFPAELALFLFGAIAHQFLLPLYGRVFGSSQLKKLSVISVVLAVLLLFGFSSLYDLMGYRVVVGGLMLFVMTLPLLFQFQNNNDIDKQVGDLSYPIYICHWVIVNSTGLIWGLDVFASPVIQVIGLLGVLGFAWGLDRLVAQPMERFRRQFRQNMH